MAFATRQFLAQMALHAETRCMMISVAWEIGRVNGQTIRSFTPIPGTISKPGILDQWSYDSDDVLNPDKYISFYHSTTAKGKVENSQIVIMEGSKEFGPGFYTTGADTDEPAKMIGEEWFAKTQKIQTG
jgi:hypothetical protein